MNGRMYDPVIGRMLSTDNFIQSPDYTQSYNRYTYALNNPLKYTDPDGELIFTILAAALAPPLLPLAIAMDIGGMMNVMANGQQMLNNGGGNFWGNIASSYGVGAAAGGAAYITGGAALSALGLTIPTTIGAQALAGAVGSGVGAMAASPILGYGNQFYFGSEYNSTMFFRDVGFGFLSGGIIGLVAGIANHIPKGKIIAKPPKGHFINNELTDDNILSVAKRVGRDGNAVEVKFNNGGKMDINQARVKEYVPNNHPKAPKGTLQKVRFNDALPHSAGLKRLPTQGELDFLNNIFKP